MALIIYITLCLFITLVAGEIKNNPFDISYLQAPGLYGQGDRDSRNIKNEDTGDGSVKGESKLLLDVLPNEKSTVATNESELNINVDVPPSDTGSETNETAHFEDNNTGTNTENTNSNTDLLAHFFPEVKYGKRRLDENDKKENPQEETLKESGHHLHSVWSNWPTVQSVVEPGGYHYYVNVNTGPIAQGPKFNQVPLHYGKDNFPKAGDVQKNIHWDLYEQSKEGSIYYSPIEKKKINQVKETHGYKPINSGVNQIVYPTVPVYQHYQNQQPFFVNQWLWNRQLPNVGHQTWNIVPSTFQNPHSHFYVYPLQPVAISQPEPELEPESHIGNKPVTSDGPSLYIGHHDGQTIDKQDDEGVHAKPINIPSSYGSYDIGKVLSNVGHRKNPAQKAFEHGRVEQKVNEEHKIDQVKQEIFQTKSR